MKTLEEKKVELAEFTAKAEDAAQRYNAAVLDNKGLDTLMSISAEIDEAVDNANKVSEEIAYDTALADGPEKALYNAAIILEYPIIRAQDTKVDPDDDMTVKVINPAVKRISPVKLNKYARINRGKNVGDTSAWQLDVEKLGLLATKDVAHDINPALEAEIEKKYKISKKGAASDLKLSNREYARSLQRIVDSMIGADCEKKFANVVSHDVAFFKNTFTSRGKSATTVRCANTSRIYEIMLAIAHHMITGEAYGLEYKQKKEVQKPAQPTEAPKAEEPKTEEPKAEAPKPAKKRASRKKSAKAAEPKAEASETEEPKTEVA